MTEPTGTSRPRASTDAALPCSRAERAHEGSETAPAVPTSHEGVPEAVPGASEGPRAARTPSLDTVPFSPPFPRDEQLPDLDPDALDAQAAEPNPRQPSPRSSVPRFEVDPLRAQLDAAERDRKSREEARKRDPDDFMHDGMSP